MLRRARRRVEAKPDELGCSCPLATPCNCPSRTTLSTTCCSATWSPFVSDAVKLIEETRRVTREGGQIVIINHFRSANRVVGAIEKWLCLSVPSTSAGEATSGLHELVEQTRSGSGLPLQARQRGSFPDGLHDQPSGAPAANRRSPPPEPRHNLNRHAASTGRQGSDIHAEPYESTGSLGLRYVCGCTRPRDARTTTGSWNFQSPDQIQALEQRAAEQHKLVFIFYKHSLNDRIARRRTRRQPGRGVVPGHR